MLGGKASVARLRRVKPEASALIHDYVTETYYIMSGSGTFVTGGSLGGAKPTDLSNVNAGMSQTGTRIGGEARRVKPGDIVIVPAGTPHSFSELDGPIEYLVYRFEPSHEEVIPGQTVRTFVPARFAAVAFSAIPPHCTRSTEMGCVC